MHIEDHMKRSEPNKLHELDAKSVEDQRVYWDGVREEQRLSAIEELGVLREQENEAQRTLSLALGGIRVVAPAGTVELAKS